MLKYCLFIAVVCSLFACQREEDIWEEEPYNLDFEAIEGIWRCEDWQTDAAGNTRPLTVQFSEISRSGTLLRVPSNSWGYNNNEIAFRALENLPSGFGDITGEMQLKTGNPAQTTWTTVIIGGDRMSISVRGDCINCPNQYMLFIRQ